MAATPLTFEDLRIGITTTLKGVAASGVAIGRGTMDMAANKALIRVLADVSLAEHAGTCYLSASQSFTSGVGSLPADSLMPLAMDIPSAKAILKTLVETLRIDTTGLAGNSEYVYTFAGTKVLIRPYVASGTLHYIKAPDLMVNGADAFPLGAALFQPCVLAACLVAAEKMAGADPEQLARMQNQYDAIVARLNGRTDKDLLMAWASQAARSIQYGPAASGAGL